METTSKKLFNNTVQAKQRRERAIKRLEHQKKIGMKVVKDEPHPVPLSEKDIKRIDNELFILKSRI